MHTLWLSSFWTEYGQRSRPYLVSQKSRGSEGKYEMNHSKVLLMIRDDTDANAENERAWRGWRLSVIMAAI